VVVRLPKFGFEIWQPAAGASMSPPVASMRRASIGVTVPPSSPPQAANDVARIKANVVVVRIRGT
jgi:hypothetical protein